MKRVLITGKGSYIGTRVEAWLRTYPEKYEVEVLDMIGSEWKRHDFHGYDSIFHVAGIVHRKDAASELYEQVNYLLAVEVAKKAAASDVKQFIFMSSGAVYSQNDRKHKEIIVDEKTSLKPSTPYGVSKMKAEREIQELANRMRIAILRPPMVYGNGAKGNYNSLREIALKLHFFPYVNNKRSMIYIDNLCEFVRLVIENNESGVFLPQNREYVNTTELVKEIAKCNNKRVYLLRNCSFLLEFLSLFSNSINKAFGTFFYRKDVDYFNGKYQIIEFTESIRATEGWRY